MDLLPKMSVLILRGEIDLSNVKTLEDGIGHLFRRDLPLLLDLSGVRYIDATGLNLLSRTHDACRMRRIPFAVVANSLIRRICGVLSLQTSLKTGFPIFPTATLAQQYLLE